MTSSFEEGDVTRHYGYAANGRRAGLDRTTRATSGYGCRPMLDRYILSSHEHFVAKAKSCLVVPLAILLIEPPVSAWLAVEIADAVFLYGP